MVLPEKIGQGLPELMRRSHLASRLQVTPVEILQRQEPRSRSVDPPGLSQRLVGFHRRSSDAAASRYTRTSTFQSPIPCPKTVLGCRRRKLVGASTFDDAAQNRALAPGTASKQKSLDVACPDAASQSDDPGHGTS
ncbi:hypothetical protein HPB52_002159 [Rhipicephalus sanguineus]|uniref:Uncharacterized protein n=1 Tax=Rhipicephalus sanguineus TaxID=34632 RepID=A0A9D4T2Q0_RHISA|nr:hypothetical protein HPB52_002159 [Rhipicephalus sanguineus]